MNTAFTRTTMLLLAVPLALIGGCGNGGQAPSPVEPDPPTLVIDTSHEAQLSGDKALGSPISATRQEPEKVVSSDRIYDFAANLDRAHLRSGGLLVDMGTPSRNKYTIGDWKTGWRGNFSRGDTTFSYLSGTAARIFFELGDDEAGGGAVTLRAAAVGSTRGRVYLNGKQIGVAELPREGYGHSTLEFDAGLRAGTNELLLRFNTRKPGHDRKGASIAVDYIRVETAGTGAGPAASSTGAVLLPDASGGDPDLVLRPGESLTFNVPIPVGATLRGGVRSRSQGGKGVLRVTGRVDGQASELLKELPARQNTGRLSIDLSAFGGKSMSIRFEAEGGEIVLANLGLHARMRAGARAPGKTSAKNVVLVLIDTLRADHLHAYNEETRVQTPYMDELAGESMVFERPLAQENWTKPSVATLLTGLYPETHQTKTEKNKVPRTVSLVSEHLRKLGFATAGFVANGYVSGKFGFERGWDKWTNYVREGKPNRAQFVADHSIQWLKSRPKDKPFFLYIHTIDPHVPYIPPKKYRALYDDEPYNGQVNPRNTAKLLEGVKTGAVKLSQRDKFRLEALYDGEISYHDDHLARVHRALEEEGLLEDTLIVITSDHGEEFFEHGSVGHGHSMYEELLHVPLVIRLPGASPSPQGRGARSGAEVGLVDVVPTMCDILAVDCPAEVEGRSLVKLLEGAPIDGWPQVGFSDFLDGQRVARMGRYKLIYRGLSTTLFDLEGDPNETTDLSDQLPITLATLRESLGGHQGRFVVTAVPGAPAEGGDVTDEKKVRVTPRKEPKHEQEDAKIDPETRKQLEALGYMGD